MTKNLPIEDLLPKAGDSIYRLVRMAASRAMELAEGRPPLIEKPSTDKETTTALEEIHQGCIIFEDGVIKRILSEGVSLKKQAAEKAPPESLEISEQNMEDEE